MFQKILQNQIEGKNAIWSFQVNFKNYKYQFLYRKAFKIVSENHFFFFLKEIDVKGWPKIRSLFVASSFLKLRHFPRSSRSSHWILKGIYRAVPFDETRPYPLTVSTASIGPSTSVTFQCQCMRTQSTPFHSKCIKVLRKIQNNSRYKN